MLSRNLVFCAVAVHLVAAWFSVGHYHVDEHHQILEFSRVLSEDPAPENLAWGYHDVKIRSGFQPHIAWAVAAALEAAGIPSPFAAAFVLRLLSGALALAASFLFLSAFLPDLRTRSAQRAAAWTTLLLWVLVFVHVRFSSEGWAASLMLLALALYRKFDAAKNRPGFAWVGFALGLAFLARYQIGLMLAGFGFWLLLVRRTEFPALAALAAGAAAALILGAALDWRFYGEPTLSWANYLAFHLESPTSTERSPLYYLNLSAVAAPPIGVLLAPALACFWVLARRHPLTWTTVPYVLAHFYLENKQARFMFPLLPMLPLIAATMWERAAPWLSARPKWSAGIRRTAVASAALNIPLLLFAMLFPASKEIAMWRDCILPLAQKEGAVLHLRDAGMNRNEMALDFYNAGRVRIEMTADESELAGADFSRRVFYAARKERGEQIRAAGFEARLECVALPEWVLAVNINNWTSRASVWRVWEISPARDFPLKDGKTRRVAPQ